MSSRTRLALGLLGSALFLGLLGDELLRATPLGLNLFLWVVGARRRAARAQPLAAARRSPAAGAGCCPMLVLFAGLVVWRDSTVARRARHLRDRRRARARRAAHAAAAFTARASPTTRSGSGTRAQPRAGARSTLMQRGHRLEGAAEGARRPGRRSPSVAGSMLAAPLLLLFGALFVAADSVFQDYVSNAVPNPDEL